MGLVVTWTYEKRFLLFNLSVCRAKQRGGIRGNLQGQNAVGHRRPRISEARSVGPGVTQDDSDDASFGSGPRGLLDLQHFWGEKKLQSFEENSWKEFVVFQTCWHVVAFLRLKGPAKRRTKNMIPNANGCLSISERPDETMMAYQIEDLQINCLDIHANRPWYCTSFCRRGKALPKTRASYKAFESILRSQVPSMLAPRVKDAGKHIMGNS